MRAAPMEEAARSETPAPRRPPRFRGRANCSGAAQPARRPFPPWSTSAAHGGAADLRPRQLSEAGSDPRAGLMAVPPARHPDHAGPAGAGHADPGDRRLVERRLCPRHVTCVEYRHPIRIHLAPPGFALEQRSQRPVARQQRQVETVAVQQFPPWLLARRAACGSPIRSPDRRNRCARRRRRAVADTGEKSGSRPTGPMSGCGACAAAASSVCRFRSTARTGNSVSGKLAGGADNNRRAAETGSQRLARGRRPNSCASSQKIRIGLRRPGARRQIAAQYAAAPEATTGAAAIAKNGTWRAERSARKSPDQHQMPQSGRPAEHQRNRRQQ